MEKTVQCPNCLQMVTADSDFCIFCGAALPAVSSAPAAGVSSGAPAGKKRCKNGHEFDDPELAFCPLCGLPFADAPDVPADGWVCACGHLNPGDNLFCEACSEPRESRLKRTSPPAPGETSILPDGMYAPSADDIVPRKWKK